MFLIPEIAYIERRLSGVWGNIGKTVQMLQSEYADVFKTIDTHDHHVHTHYCSEMFTYYLKSMKFNPHMGLVVMHTANCSFGLRISVFNQNNFKEKFVTDAAKKMNNAQAISSDYSKALEFFEQKSKDRNFDLSYYDKSNMHLALSTGNIEEYGPYRVMVQMSMAKEGFKAFR